MHYCHPPPPKKNQVCILDTVEPLRTGAVQCWCSLLQSKMKETNKISHGAAIMATLKWKSQRRARCEVKSLFLLFPQLLFEKLLTDADDASVQPKKALECLALMSHSDIFLPLICLIKSTSREESHDATESQKKAVWSLNAQRVPSGNSGNFR